MGPFAQAQGSMQDQLVRALQNVGAHADPQVNSSRVGETRIFWNSQKHAPRALYSCDLSH